MVLHLLAACESCWILQELCFGFWENIAALLLQPDLSDGLQPYLNLTTALHRAGKSEYPFPCSVHKPMRSRLLIFHTGRQSTRLNGEALTSRRIVLAISWQVLFLCR